MPHTNNLPWAPKWPLLGFFEQNKRMIVNTVLTLTTSQGDNVKKKPPVELDCVDERACGAPAR